MSLCFHRTNEVQVTFDRECDIVDGIAQASTFPAAYRFLRLSSLDALAACVPAGALARVSDGSKTPVGDH
jgi:hypothetical protein